MAARSSITIIPPPPSENSDQISRRSSISALGVQDGEDADSVGMWYYPRDQEHEEHHTPRRHELTEQNPLPAPINEIDSFVYLGEMSKIVLIMVGLPARGKTFLSRKLARYLTWMGIRVKSFNIGAYRRIGAKDLTIGKLSANYFDPKNSEAARQRETFALYAMQDMANWLAEEDGQIGILDGTNSTLNRRRSILEFFTEQNFDAKIIFCESVCTDEDLINANILAVKMKSPDYAHVPPEQIVADFRKRIAHYAETYDTVSERDGPFIKLINSGETVIGHDVKGYLPGRLFHFLMQLNLAKKSIFLTRHGESEYNVQNKIGGDSPLSEMGQEYARKLAEYFENFEDAENMKIFTSTLRRTKQTARHFPDTIPTISWQNLSEIDAGVFDGWTYEEVREKRPAEYDARQADKLRYRYPQGESYQDVIQRLEPVILELERSEGPVLIIAHRAVIRCLYAYFLDRPLKEVPHQDISLHTLYKLSPTDYGTEAHPLPLMD